MSDDISYCYDAYRDGCKKFECERHPIHQKARKMECSYVCLRGSDICIETKEKKADVK